MELSLDNIKLFLKNKAVYPVIILYVVIIALLGFAGYTGYEVYGLYNSMSVKDVEVETAQASVNLLRKNRTILEGDIDTYNTALSKAIPETESYFSVISALEELAGKTGVEIVEYSIDLDQTTQSKLTLSVEVNGAIESINTLYENYRYASGRLLTCDKITITNSEEGRTVISFNFYHSPTSKSIQNSQEQITSKDIEYVKEVVSQLN